MQKELQTAPAPSTRDPALDGLRGLAILLVFFFHYGGGLRSRQPFLHALGYLSQAGWVGVELFFALSGYLITSILLSDIRLPGFLHNFYLRRARRILPLYYLALAVCAAVTALRGGTSFVQLRPLLVYAAFLQNVPPWQHLVSLTPPALPLYHLWSLAVEEQFYLIWPLLLVLARTPRRTLALCCSVFLLSLLFRIKVADAGYEPARFLSVLAASLPVRAGGLAAGSALAALGRLEPFSPRPLAAPLLATGALAAFCLFSARSHSTLLGTRLNFAFGLTCVDLGAAALVALALSSGLTRTLFSLPALASLGRISYGFYVWHVLLMPLFDQAGLFLTHTSSGYLYQTARLLIAFPLTLAVSWLSFTLLEQPMLRRGSRNRVGNCDVLGRRG